MVQPKVVELETELVLAVEQILLIPSLNFDGAVGPKEQLCGMCSRKHCTPVWIWFSCETWALNTFNRFWMWHGFVKSLNEEVLL